MLKSRRNATQSRSSRRRRSPDSCANVDLHMLLQTELQYPPWWTREGVMSWYRELPDDTLWNCYICAAVLVAIVWVAANLEGIYIDILDVVYNISYAAHVLSILYKIFIEMDYTDVSVWVAVGYVIDLGTYSHYINRNRTYKLACYYLRLHRPFKYLWSLYNYNLKGCILGTTLKYCYIFVVLRITWAWVWLHVNLLEQQVNFVPPKTPSRRMNVQLTDMDSNDSDTTKFLSSLYIVNKMFIPIGLPVVPDNDIERMTCLLVILSGCLVVTGAAVATLSLVISLYMSSEETFRSRYKLIIKEMKDSNVPPKLSQKVQKFYRMYWHKQRAVSETRLLPTVPPTLPATVYTDIYFEATQKSRILRDLSYQFLSELAKKMETIHYIPGDAIIERNSKKSSIIYITYGDIEMLTAEDDTTAILRFTRGTVLTPCGGVAAAAVDRSHLAVRAATFCTAQVLHAADLWRTVNKHSVSKDNGGPILDAFTDHIEKVKRHYSMKIPVASLHKSSILHFNRNLMALKEMKDANGQPLLGNTDVFLEIAGCYIMRNRLDSTLTDESDAICLRPTFPCILQPSSSLLIAWHTAVASLILIICITHPYYLVFLKDAPVDFRFFDYVASMVYVVDLIVHLSTGAHVEKGVPITFTQTSSQQMRSKWFVLDVFSTLPIFEFIGDGHFAGINKILRLPKVFRLLKVMEDSCVYHSNLLRFCSYTLLLLIACYLIAALQQAFMCFQSGYCLVTNFTHSPFWEKKELDEETVAARLTFGLYWAISMIMFTTHMETWGKENMSNVMYTMIILEFCIVLRTFMEAVYSATIMVTTAMREDYDACIATVKHFLIRNDVDPELRKRFITYLQLCWYTDKAYKMTHHAKTSSIFYDLPQHVYQDIVGRNRVKYILCIPFMKMLNKEELKQLASNAHLYYTSPNEILMNTGDLVNEMYVVVKGICEVISPKTHKKVDEFTTKCHFGGVVCILRIPAYYTVRAVTHVQIFCISMRHLKPVFENPQIKEAIEYVKSQPVYTRMQKRQPSFLKYEPLPPIPNTERFPLPRKHEPDFAYLHPFRSLGFLSILRYIFPRYTIRPDGKYLIRYEWVRVSCALMSAMVFPNYTYLVLQWPWLYYFTWLLDLSAIFDIFQRMLVGYYNKDGILVYHPSSTAANYMKGPFIVDLIGCLALENLESERIETYEDGYRVTPMEQFLMMNRLLQLYRFPSIMQTLQFYIERRDIHMIIYAIPLFISMFNILTSLMIFNSVKIFYFINDDGQTRWLLEPFQDKGGSWIDLFRNTFRFNLTSSPWNLYLATHFWVVYETTTTGYAKFKPSNNHLMEILFIGMAMSAMIITYFSVRIISIRSNVNKPLAGFQQHMRDITVFMSRENLDTTLQRELRCYYEYNWEKMGGINYRGMLKLCNQITLRTDAILHIYGPTFAKCPLLANCDVSLLRMIGRSVRSVYFLRDMKIIEYDDVVRDVYFVDYGGVESRVSLGELDQVVRLPRGSLFGNLEGCPSQRVPMNIVATSRLHLLMINSQAFYHIINEFPVTKALMEKSRQADNKYYILGNMEDFKVKLTRERVSAPVRNRKMAIIKYISFQEGLVLLYLIVVSLSCIYMDMYNAGYQDNRAWLILTLYSLDMCFFLKVLMQFSLPLLVINKTLKTLLLPIRRMYFKREFKYDLISCVPIELLAFQITENRWFWFSWLRLNRMFRIVTVFNCLKQHNERINLNLTVSTILAVSIWFSVFVHATTCLWYFIGRLEEQAQPKSSWIYNDEGSSWCGNEYICSLYFVITTFTQSGVGDIMPKKQSEVIFVTILMIISTMVFMIYVGEFSNIIQYQSFRSFSFYTEYLELQEFLKNNRVSRNLVNIVNKYTLHLWRESRGLQVPHFLVNAPLSLRLRVMSAAYMHHITRHRMLRDCEPAFLRQLVGCLRLYTYNEDMYVVKENEITDCMYVIHRGKVKEINSEDMLEGISPTIYPSGSSFGILQGLVRDTPYTHSYQTTIKSQVLTLHLDDWEYLLEHFPQSKNTLHKHMSNTGYGNISPSKWPGGLDPDPPLDTEASRETETEDNNLPKFLRYTRRTTDTGSSGRIYHQQSSVSTTSSVSISTDASKYDLFETFPRNSKTSVLGPTTTSAVKTPKLQSETEHFNKQQVPREVGIKERIANTVKKLMGRYSDTNLSLTDSEIREEFFQDEKATSTLLRQLVEANRKSRELNKNKHRSDKRKRKSSIEDEEKFMHTINLSDSGFDKSSNTDSQTAMMRQLLIRDEESMTNVNTGAVKRESLNAVTPPDTGTASDISDSKIVLPLKHLEKDKSSTHSKMATISDTSVYAGTLIVSDTEATPPISITAVMDTGVIQQSDVNTLRLQETHVIESIETTNNKLANIDDQPDSDIEINDTQLSLHDADIQPIPDDLKKADSETDQDNNLYPTNTDTETSTQVTINLQYDVNTSKHESPDWGARIKQKIDADVLEINNSIDIQPIPDIKTSRYSQPDADIQPISETQIIADNKTQIDIEQKVTDTSKMGLLKTQIKLDDVDVKGALEATPYTADIPAWGTRIKQEIDADLVALPDIQVIKDILTPVDSNASAIDQPIPDVKTSRFSELDADIQSVSKAIEKPDNKTDKDIELRSTDIRTEPVTQAIDIPLNVSSLHVIDILKPVTSVEYTRIAKHDTSIVNIKDVPNVQGTTDIIPDLNTPVNQDTTLENRSVTKRVSYKEDKNSQAVDTTQEPQLPLNTEPIQSKKLDPNLKALNDRRPDEGMSIIPENSTLKGNESKVYNQNNADKDEQLYSAEISSNSDFVEASTSKDKKITPPKIKKKLHVSYDDDSKLITSRYHDQDQRKDRNRDDLKSSDSDTSITNQKSKPGKQKKQP